MPRIERHGRRVLGGAARRIRTLKGLTGDVVSTRAGVTVGYLSKIEHGIQQPSLEVMHRLATALEVDLDDITYLATIYAVTDDDAHGLVASGARS